MIDKDTLRVARRTVERNGYTVLPPRESDERDLDRFRSRRELARQANEDDDEDYRPARPTTRQPRYEEEEEYEERPVRKARTTNYEDDGYEEERPVRKTRPAPRYEDDFEDERYSRPTRPAPRYREVVEEDPEPQRKFKPLRTREDDYEETRPTRPVRKEMNDDEKLGAAIRTAEENGFTIRKMSRLDQAKQVARDHGFDVHRIEKAFDGEQIKKPVAPVAGGNEGNDRPVRRVATQDGTPIRRPVLDREMARKNADGIRTRTAPDVEMKKEVPTQDAPKDASAEAPKAEQPVETPKKPTYEDDYINRAAAFFGDDV
jgi:hypothetical protein